MPWYTQQLYGLLKQARVRVRRATGGACTAVSPRDKVKGPQAVADGLPDLFVVEA